MSYLLGGHSDAMVGVIDDAVCLVPFKKATGTKKPLPREILALFNPGNITRVYMTIVRTKLSQWAAVGLNLNQAMVS